MEIVVETRDGSSYRRSSSSEMDRNHDEITSADNPEVTLRQRRTMGEHRLEVEMTPKRASRPDSNSYLGGDFIFLDLPDNDVEEHKMTQNYMFGFKKWKSHLTVRPFQERSDVVKKLYEEPKEIKSVSESTITVGNVLYVILIGWLLALVYSLVSILMFLTIIGYEHGIFCFKLAKYFIWPFGYFVQEQTTYELEGKNERHVVVGNNVGYHKNADEEVDVDENTPLSVTRPRPDYVKINTAKYWKRPSTYVWLLLGMPLLLIVHAIIICLTWFTVVLIPVCKLNIITIRKVLLMPPEKLHINKSSTIQHSKGPSEVIMCSYEAVNLYYYKYTVDGMNVILVNLLVFVVITLLLGYLDKAKEAVDTNVKFVMGLMAIIPLAYYIGMGIASISAQSTHAVGAVLNATFGSIVEIILYISALIKYKKGTGPCYEDLVQSALTGTLLATMLLVPGICMIVGGLKHSEQRFNMKSAAVSASLLFVSVAGAFTPTIFSKTYGSWICQHCNDNNNTLTCLQCHNNLVDKDGDFYSKHVVPLIYICASLSLFAYVVGLVYTLKTHAHILEEHLHAIQHAQHKSVVHWGRIKSSIILLLSVVAMSLCAEVVVQNMEPILTESGVSELFIGVTILAVVPDIPEIMNGVQFAMRNNISLSIDIGSSVAVQVCLVQIPVLVLANAIWPELHFHMVFNDLHLWSVIISVIIMNFLFNDGKADYFQGTTLCVVYIIMLAMYLFSPDENHDKGCLDDL